MLHTFHPNILDNLSCLNTPVTVPKMQQTYHPHDTAVSFCYVYPHYIEKHCHAKISQLVQLRKPTMNPSQDNQCSGQIVTA